MKDLP